jgi:uncharacterized protein
LLNDRSLDAVSLNPPAIHALWTLHGLGLVNEGEEDVMTAVYQSLSHPSAGVRKNAVRVLPATGENLMKIKEAGLLADRDGGVRLAAIQHLIDQPESDETGSMLYDLAKEKSVIADEWLARAVYAGAVKHKAAFTRAMHARESDRIATGYEDDKQVVDYSGDGIETTGWQNIETPSRWSKTSARELQNFDGIVWVRREFEIAAGLAGKSARLSLGPVDDTDDTYLNGKRIGGMERKWDEVREYAVPAGLLRPGKNQLTVRISDSGGRGGIYGEKEQVFIQLGNEKIDLSGIWKYKIEEQFKPDQEVFEDGIEITDLFLKHYGPYARELSKQLPNVAHEEFDRIIEMKTVPDQMRYDQEELEVSAGEKVKIVFSNNDGMQHNLLIGSPGSLEMIGKAADQMAQSAAGAEREYIPQLTVVLAAAGLVDPGETREIVWDVPDEPGDYIIVCTFPGHWRTMNAVIRVKKQVQL